jgi:hypothetical protein
MTHDSVLLLTSAGRAYCTRAWRIPDASRTSGGAALAQVWAAGMGAGGGGPGLGRAAMEGPRPLGAAWPVRGARHTPVARRAPAARGS